MKRTILFLSIIMLITGAAVLPAQNPRELKEIDYESGTMRQYERALRLYLRQEYDRAERAVEEALRISPDAIEPQWLLANIYHKTGRLGLMMQTVAELGIRERTEAQYLNELVRSRSQGYVLRNQGDQVRIDFTESKGAEVGGRYIVYEEGDILRHPVTLSIVDVAQPARGTIEVVEVLDTHSVAQVIERNGNIERGMRVIDEEQYASFSLEPEQGAGASEETGGQTFIPLDGEYDGLAMSEPEGLAVDGQGRIVVADTGNDRVVRLDAQGGFDAAFGVTGSGEDQFRAPVSVVPFDDGLYVVERANHRVHVLSGGNLAHDRVIGSRGINAPGQFTVPQKVLAAGGELFVLDVGNRRVQVLGDDGAFLGEDITAEAVNNNPTTFTVTESAVYMLDPLDGVVHQFARQAPYDLQQTIDLPAEVAGESIVDMTSITREGSQYFALVLDQADQIVLMDAELSAVVTTIGESGRGEGQFSDPVRVKAQGNQIYVLERGNLRVQVLSDVL